MTNSTIIIDGLPKDDNLYIVTNYGGFVKNHSFASDIPLVNVHLGIIQDNKIVDKHYATGLIGLPELSVVRIGSVWRNGVVASAHWKEYNNYQEQKSLSFNLEDNQPECIAYACDKEHTNNFSNLEEINFENIEDVLSKSNQQIYGSTFVKFTGRNKKTYIVPSLELLMSTYVPRNKIIRNQLILNPLQNIITNYIEEYSISSKYYIKIEKALEKETMFFLAYICCNDKTKSTVSKIWTHLESANHSNIKHPYILPYHTKKISFKASGVWINDNLFFIQRIDAPKPPNEIKVEVKCHKTIAQSEDFQDNDMGDLDDTNPFSNFLNQNKVKKKTKVTAQNSPGRIAGVKHIVSEVCPDNSSIECDVDEQITIVDNKPYNSYSKNDVEIDGASSGKPSEQSGSKKIARTDYKVEKNPEEIAYIKEITDTLINLDLDGTIQSLTFIDDHAQEHKNIVYMSFNQHHIQLNDNKFWASNFIKGSGISKKKSGYRKLLLSKFVLEGKQPLYLLEIIKKIDSDAFYGVIFQLDMELKFSDLEIMKYVIASNKGHFKGKNSLPFPFKAAKFKHTWGKMDTKLNALCTSIKESNFFV